MKTIVDLAWTISSPWHILLCEWIMCLKWRKPWKEDHIKNGLMKYGDSGLFMKTFIHDIGRLNTQCHCTKLCGVHQRWHSIIMTIKPCYRPLCSTSSLGHSRTKDTTKLAQPAYNKTSHTWSYWNDLSVHFFKHVQLMMNNQKLTLKSDKISFK